MHGLFIDNFCGGGGASTGIAAAIGREPDIAINHSPEAIAVHKANHPATEHCCQDIWQAIPIQVTRAQHVGGAWFSPDCKEHSKAKGGPVKDRNIRDLGWTVVSWMEAVSPDVVYLENVEEFQQWGPLICIDGKWCIDPARRGETWRRWCKAIRRLGYRLEFRELRACDYGAPTSRKRLYVIARRDGRKIVWPKPSHGRPDSPGVRAGKLLPYRTAAECIDWTLPCPSIFLSPDEAREAGVRRPLKDNTLRRVAHGVMRYVVNAAEPFIVPVTHTGSPTRIHPVSESLRTITTANGGEFMAADATVAPIDAGFVADRAYTNTRASRVFDASDPLRTSTTQESFMSVQATLAPHITKFHSGSVGAPMDGTMPTVTGNGEPARPAGAMPLGTVVAHLEKFAENSRGRSAAEPLDTVMAGAPRHGVIASTLAQLQNGERRAGEEPRGQDPTAPASTIATGGKFAAVQATMVEAALLDRQFGRSRGAAAGEPAPATMAGGGGKTAQVSAFLSTFHGSNKTASAGDLEQPGPTALAEGQHQAIVCAHVEQANTGGMLGRTASAPFTTITATGAQQRLVQTTILPEDALSPEMMARANLVAGFLVKYYGAADHGQVVDYPFHTVTTLPRFAVVTVTIDAVTYVIVDIGLRMLTPRELARAQGFPDSYVLDPFCWQEIRGKQVWKRLTKAAQIRMIGNSVCPDVARALVAANQPGANDNWQGTVSEWRMAA